MTPRVLAQPGPGGGYGWRAHGGNTNEMQWRREMMQERQKTIDELNRMDATLKKDVARMKEAQGSAKTDAMATVIEDLVKQHDLTRNAMNEMHQRVMSHMQQRHGMMGGSEQDNGGSNTGQGKE